MPRNGDVIPITIASEALDIALGGFATSVDARPHVINAPVVGEDVHISELPLAERAPGSTGRTGSWWRGR